MEIRAFRGWRYCVGPDRDVSRYIAPPYDILSERDKQELLAASDKNIVAVDMPHVPPKDLGPEHLYREAAERLKQWRTSGVLRREDRPAVYVYEQAFRRAGRDYTRRALLCGVRATEPGKDVIPHEHTFPGPKADRLKLTECTQMQLSPIFGFYSEPSGVVAGAISRAADGPPDARGVLRGVTEKLWAVTDAAAIGDIARALRDTPVFIADGHHRYTTQLNYRDALAAARTDPNHEANFVLFALVARDDPGLLILPTHRIIRGMKKSFSIQRLIDNSPEFAWERCSVHSEDLGDADGMLRPYGAGAMALIDARPRELWIARLKDRQAMNKTAPEQVDAWRGLDVAILHKLIIDKDLEPWHTPGLSIEYTPDGKGVLAACTSGAAQLGICLQATPLSAVEAIARAGQVMPHKSTYFYPKLSTGMVLKPLE